MTAARQRLILAGAALVVASNAVVLAGVAYNRSGEPDSRFVLSEREVTRDGAEITGATSEDSGLSLRLQWTVARRDSATGCQTQPGWWSYGGMVGAGDVAWLNRAKLEELGIHVPSARELERRGVAFDRGLGRDVFVALEFDGPAYTAALEGARAAAALCDAGVLSDPADHAKSQSAAQAHSAVARLSAKGTRLFVVDAAPDPAALRHRYPDRAHYAIVRAHVQPEARLEHGQMLVSGLLSSVRATTVNVPVHFRHAVDGIPPSFRPIDASELGPITVEIDFGRRLEPWIAAVHANSPATGGVSPARDR